MSERKFPILGGGSIPWEMVAAFEAQAIENHSQTLEKLASRGGLSPHELLMVLHGVRWFARTSESEVDRKQSARIQALSKGEAQVELAALVKERSESAALTAAAERETKLREENERLNDRIDDLLNCSSFACPYEKRMQAAEAEVERLKAERDKARDAHASLCPYNVELQAERQKVQALLSALSDMAKLHHQNKEVSRMLGAIIDSAKSIGLTPNPPRAEP